MNTCAIEDCERPVLARGWCRLHYHRWHRHGDPLYVKLDAVEERFWAKVNKMGPVSPLGTRCWVWTGATNSKNYGQFQVKDRGMVRAHAFSLELATGEAPAGRHTCHRCDNPPCVRPDHLFYGTRSDNMKDMVTKGRSPRGERSGSVLLTEAQVVAIRDRRAMGESSGLLAREFGVSQPAITAISRGDHWAHVGGPITRQARPGRRSKVSG